MTTRADARGAAGHRPWKAGPRAAIPLDRVFPAPGPRQPWAPTALVIDGDEDARTIAAEALRHAGYRTLTGRSGEDAIRLALEERPDLVVMEIRLRYVDGLRALEVLRDDPRTAAIPVVLLTTHADPATQALARAAGCSAYLTKPCPPTELVQEANELLHARRSGLRAAS